MTCGVVTSTMAAEAYAMSEGIEFGLYVRSILLDIFSSAGSVKPDKGFVELEMPIYQYTDSDGLHHRM